MPDEIPLAQLDPESSWDPDMEASATAALRALQPSVTEHAGLIYQNPQGQYARSIATTQGARDGFALRAQLNANQKLAAIWHVHPGDDDNGQIFSPNDVATAEKLKVPSYVLFQKDNSIRKYTPGKTKTYDLPSADKFTRNFTVSRGDPVGVNPDQTRKMAVEQAYADVAKSGPTS